MVRNYQDCLDPDKGKLRSIFKDTPMGKPRLSSGPNSPASPNQVPAELTPADLSETENSAARAALHLCPGTSAVQRTREHHTAEKLGSLADNRRYTCMMLDLFCPGLPVLAGATGPIRVTMTDTDNSRVQQMSEIEQFLYQAALPKPEQRLV